MNDDNETPRETVLRLMAEAEGVEPAADPLRLMLAAACATMMRSDAALRQLVGLRIQREFLLDLYARELIGVGQVSIAADGGLWEPDGPDRRLLLAVCEHGEPVDVLALSSSCEDEWALLTGMCPLLGWDAWRQAQVGITDRLRIWPTPMAWLRAGGTGACVLRWDAEAIGMLRGLGEGVRLIVDAGAKDRLRAILAYGGLPRIEAAAVRPEGKIAA